MSSVKKSWFVKFIIKKGGQAVEMSLSIHGENAVRALNDFFDEQSVRHGILRSDIDVTAMNIV
ncbi:hypothetical protein COO59_02755 [Mixta theicola]|uniref:Uncharacterized protein n=1 Tax=Mixta theicola TaxID=1458355 RepID=A0A2K1QCV4_9GAMM|nr:hypothetical protein [Mixta theicola]PNS12857.1 hypothetical protein COO59_02755 [Mixta theicola]GLR09106.1 hypothetical protein GCM10007905_18260 [Mixta theicola]